MNNLRKKAQTIAGVFSQEKDPKQANSKNLEQFNV